MDVIDYGIRYALGYLSNNGWIYVVWKHINMILMMSLCGLCGITILERVPYKGILCQRHIKSQKCKFMESIMSLIKYKSNMIKVEKNKEKEITVEIR
jgi:hypothetical protein